MSAVSLLRMEGMRGKPGKRPSLLMVCYRTREANIIEACYFGKLYVLYGGLHYQLRHRNQRANERIPCTRLWGETETSFVRSGIANDLFVCTYKPKPPRYIQFNL